MHRRASELGEPDLAFGGLQMWIHGHDAEEDWLTITAHCGAQGASVWVNGQILQLADLMRFGEQCVKLQAGSSAGAELVSYEPNLNVELKPPGRRGEIEMIVNITPDNLTQEHQFRTGVDLSYLPELQRGLTRIVARFRGE
jgi:hypothetical protein